MRTFGSVDDLTAAVGEELGPTDWLRVEQARVDSFADATGDHQWIHVDPERAAGGPFGTTIAHGYLTLSLIPWFGAQLFAIDRRGATLNYGVEKVRFPHPVRVGARVRARSTFVEISRREAGHRLVTRYVIEVEGEPKPACVAETVVLLLD